MGGAWQLWASPTYPAGAPALRGGLEAMWYCWLLRAHAYFLPLQPRMELLEALMATRGRDRNLSLALVPSNVTWECPPRPHHYQTSGHRTSSGCKLYRQRSQGHQSPENRGRVRTHTTSPGTFPLTPIGPGSLPKAVACTWPHVCALWYPPSLFPRSLSLTLPIPSPALRPLAWPVLLPS